ncbi:hypothetical protein G4H71_02860 [Rhodococcus triatomae]|uniref:UsfY protein n=1 Tax=Rhodococcus triatomae TaxID=300028 RepID=A0A1G8M235_9NOCA|nr:hypothetical protein [Rhodococcus triatomae]QNG18213.1 hypothetical protein G4H72_05180 [Rhodococcus triatomae]QNG22116.1 hypothetical protein G4H71_02860 [Rhodococcus triatomae]SDI62001.1 hypothetical protein SAMN05444695_10982 [Rhodococcus triatomae]
MTVSRSFPQQDRVRTNRSHVGEALTDTRGWPGYAMIGTAIAVLGLFLVAAGYGFTGWAAITGGTFAGLMIVGVALVLLEHRRVQREEERQDRAARS